MTDTRTLLAEYVTTGSESAFRELVIRYIDLVYLTALRLVGGDTHFAQDVCQTVFIDLSRKAHGLSSQVMLGGWLHHRTRNLAATMMRRERRRQARERQAVEMNALNSDPTGSLNQVAPMLDEAISQLGTEDRAAILLRFFEQRDFRSVGQALGSSEDAARMRVVRALEKLHSLLAHQGTTLSAAALGSALAAEAVTAAPAGLAASIAGTALASGGAGATVTVLKTLIMTKLKFGILGAIALAGVATSLVQHHSETILRNKNQSLRQQLEGLAQLQAENERLSNLLARANGSQPLPNKQLSELLRLRSEMGRLRQAAGEIENLRQENRHLRAASEQASPVAEDVGQANSNLYTRLFKVDTEALVQNLTRSSAAKEGESNQEMLSRFFKENGVELEPPTRFILDERTGDSIASDTLANLDTIESLMHKLESRQ